MAKSFFISAVPGLSGKSEAVKSAIEFTSKKSCKVAYFKPVIIDGEDSGFKASLSAAGLSGDNAKYYALTQCEALALINQGKESVLLDAVLPKFKALSEEFEAVIVEGIDAAGPAAAALSSLDAVLAANLASSVILLSGLPIEAAATAVCAYQSNHAEVFALAVVSANPGQAASEKDLPPLKGVQVWGLSSAADISTHMETACGAVCSGSKAMTPKRFEFALIERAKLDKQHIVLPEGNDQRILKAADEILKKDFAEISILGDPDQISKAAKELGLSTLLSKGQLINNKTSDLLPELAAAFYELRKNKGVTEEKAAEQVKDRNFFGTMMVKLKKADGMVSGADGTTADTIRPALSIIKTKPGCSIASSVFLMCLADRVWVFGDCAINTNPTPQQLAEIAISSAHTAKAFGVDPKVAMLSYSTGSSGTGPDVDVVKEATQIAMESAAKLYPGLPIDGPLQFDAAVDPATAKSKMPNSKVAGQATVMIFPSLTAGNIAYKAVQRTASAVAIGPVIQGLNAPVNDLSRGTLVADIVNTVAITALQAQADK